MKELISSYWRQLEKREQITLAIGVSIVGLILFYALLWQPWHKAIAHMETAVQPKRADLVWMRQQAELVKNGGVVSAAKRIKGADESLLAVIEQTAKAHKLQKSIQQMVPGRSTQEVSVVLEEADFNQWVRWVDALSKQYAVNIKQLSAERDDERANIAEIRVTFERV